MFGVSCNPGEILNATEKPTQNNKTISRDLVGGIPTPLKNMSSSVGIMKFPIYGNIKHVPNHQTVIVQNSLSFHKYIVVGWQRNSKLMDDDNPQLRLGKTTELVINQLSFVKLYPHMFDG